ncbi:hypothetical protein B0H14DRAFT_2649133 [Mycena olivaceomarginata]|nr:hypothetical protein B0H14DRAFT_2649133 [Mycena olivaceomarginata]
MKASDRAAKIWRLNSLSESEYEREKNCTRNDELLTRLNLKHAASAGALGIPIPPVRPKPKLRRQRDTSTTPLELRRRSVRLAVETVAPGSATTAAAPSAINSSSEEAAPPVEDDDASPEDAATSAENDAQIVPQAVTGDAQAGPQAFLDERRPCRMLRTTRSLPRRAGWMTRKCTSEPKGARAPASRPLRPSRLLRPAADAAPNTMPTPASPPSSTPPVPAAAPADLPSEKHRVVLGLLESEIKLPTWVAAVQAWRALETATGFQTSGKALPSRRRPSAVGWWINRARKTSQIPAVGGRRGVEGADDWEMRWIEARGQRKSGCPPRGPQRLEPVFMACLWWWYQIADVDEGTPAWRKLLSDVSWVLAEKTRAFAGKRAAPASSEEPLSKRARTQ